ncbi:hypothetical protein AB1A81_05555 [Bdellovibrio bacteriovorus]|uniref:hypothetical protein n=1 Tax=Bdellovibrio bacteriovorus TaxID=959 RepID=UPI0002FB773D|nr:MULTISPECIES: hypothetical protein [Bacteria]AHZ86436.1 hypothetical protein EP01_16060 [Bdellovibrio bacteriovorus]RLQ02403.1 hypothetical protein EAD98_00215 [Micromonospora sp. CV4]BEV67678.1 hypothetical protein Bb109J_c1098 [Bdellovibrio bacteriovorus]
MKSVLFITAFLFVWLAQAAPAPDRCKTLTETQGGVQLQRIWLEQAGICMLSVSPTDAYKDMIYRDYVLTEDGMFMVFNAYGTDGQFGARDFFLFPRKQTVISHQWVPEKDELIIEHVTGDKFVFDVNKAVLKSISGAAKVVVDKVATNNKGGVSIVGYQGQILDVGFALNQDPAMIRSGNSVLTGAQRNCSLRNLDIFNYMSDGDVIFKFRKDTDFQRLVSSACR